GLPHHRVTDVGMGEQKQKPRFFDLLLQLFGLLQVECHRLVQHHMETVFQCQHSRFEMYMVWCNDADEIHAFAFRKFALGRYHLLVASIYTVGGKVKRFAALLRSPRIGTERSAHQFDLAVHRSRDAVYFANKSTFTPAYHSHPEFAIDWFIYHNYADFVLNDTLLSLALSQGNRI